MLTPSPNIRSADAQGMRARSDRQTYSRARIDEGSRRSVGGSGVKSL